MSNAGVEDSYKPNDCLFSSFHYILDGTCSRLEGKIVLAMIQSNCALLNKLVSSSGDEGYMHESILIEMPAIAHAFKPNTVCKTETRVPWFSKLVREQKAHAL